MKFSKCLLRLLAAVAAIAGTVLLILSYWDKISAFALKLCHWCTDWTKALPTKEQICGKLSSCNPFRKAQIEAEFADYED